LWGLILRRIRGIPIALGQYARLKHEDDRIFIETNTGLQNLE